MGGGPMRINQLEILGGTDRKNRMEGVARIALHPGDTLAVVGPTGSGKSELLADIEQLTCGDTPSRRRILLDGQVCEIGAAGIVATLSQRTSFVMDTDVTTFIQLHASSLGKKADQLAKRVIEIANTLCGEPIEATDLLQRLSGGQTRALMIADIALIADTPVVLIDELENAGIDKHRALSTLSGHGKMIITATHDPVLTLMHKQRIVMKGGGMQTLIMIGDDEKQWLKYLAKLDDVLLSVRNRLRQGERLTPEVAA